MTDTTAQGEQSLDLVAIHTLRELVMLGDASKPLTRRALELTPLVDRCATCGGQSAWADGVSRTGYCQDHAPWVDQDLATRVSDAFAAPTAFSMAFASWLATAQVIGFKESWSLDGTCAPLVEYLERVTGRRLKVFPPQVWETEDRPVVMLPSWTKRFDRLLQWWIPAEGDLIPREKVLEVLSATFRAEAELAAGDPAAAGQAEIQSLPDSMRAWLHEAAAREVKASKRPGSGLFGRHRRR